MIVVFLDIDGVLNSARYLLQLEAKHRALGHAGPSRPKRETTCACFKLEHQIDAIAVERLNRLVIASGAKIVISSSWRKQLDLSELREVLATHGLVGEVVGQTPDGHEEPGMLAAYGHLERLYRGHEIDFWLRDHPEVERFVILDDDSDMAMHSRRLVQTDPDEGLTDQHVDLAIATLAWEGTGLSPGEAWAKGLGMPQALQSTRSNESADAHRDFDGFDVDEELRRLRRALRERRWHLSSELAANIDEHLCRGGSLPVAWLGPPCFREDDFVERSRATLERAAQLDALARADASEGYVGVRPAPPELPGSSWGIVCHDLLSGGCPAQLELARTTPSKPSHEEDYHQLCPALDMAAVFLGWRTFRGCWWCPAHVVAMKLVCAGCRAACPQCTCPDGPGYAAVALSEDVG